MASSTFPIVSSSSTSPTSSLLLSEEERKTLSSAEQSVLLASKFGIEFMLVHDPDDYGGEFALSKNVEFQNEIKRRLGVDDDGNNDEDAIELINKIKAYPDCRELRSHPTILGIFDDLGAEFCAGKDREGRYASLKKDYIPAGYKRWTTIEQSEYGRREFIVVDYERAHLDQVVELIDDNKFCDDATGMMNNLQSWREREGNFQSSWSYDASKRMGQVLLPMIKSRMYETGRIGNEIWNEWMEKHDIPDWIRLLQTPKDLADIINKVEKKCDTLAKRIIDIVIQSEKTSDLFDVIRNHSILSDCNLRSGASLNDNNGQGKSSIVKFLDHGIQWGEAAIELSSSDYSYNMKDCVLQQRIAPYIEAYAPSLTSDLVRAVSSDGSGEFGDAQKLYTLTSDREKVEDLLLKLLDDKEATIILDNLENAASFQTLTRRNRRSSRRYRCEIFGITRQPRRRKPFFCRFADEVPTPDDHDNGRVGMGFIVEPHPFQELQAHDQDHDDWNIHGDLLGVPDDNDDDDDDDSNSETSDECAGPPIVNQEHQQDHDEVNTKEVDNQDLILSSLESQEALSFQKNEDASVQSEVSLLSLLPQEFFDGGNNEDTNGPSYLTREERLNTSSLDVTVMTQKLEESMEAFDSKHVVENIALRSENKELLAEKCALEGKITHLLAENSHFKAEKSHFEAEKSYFKAEKSYFKAEKSCFKAEKIYFEAEKICFKAENTYFKAVNSELRTKTENLHEHGKVSTNENKEENNTWSNYIKSDPIELWIYLRWFAIFLLLYRLLQIFAILVVGPAYTYFQNEMVVGPAYTYFAK